MSSANSYMLQSKAADNRHHFCEFRLEQIL